ncbi:MAG: transcriptional regulator [Saprospiraceae bacterium]|nr:transcriptional regulator [Bacteroidia bacterium]NNE16004.1 transcriptional regulator [Saprospiraceae bacterium]NNL90704.1 transcriptional regulator [Saprospiraceae bacterium]
MEFTEAKKTFINTWGELGLNWGVNRAMGHIHALLIISPHELSADEIMSELKISRGNANMNLRALMEWQLVYRKSKPGERKDFFSAEKNLWNVFKKTLSKRKTKELNPMLHMIKNVQGVVPINEYAEEFNRVIKELEMISSAADKALDKLIQSESNFFLNSFVKVMR